MVSKHGGTNYALKRAASEIPAEVIQAFSSIADDALSGKNASFGDAFIQYSHSGDKLVYSYDEYSAEVRNISAIGYVSGYRLGIVTSAPYTNLPVYLYTAPEGELNDILSIQDVSDDYLFESIYRTEPIDGHAGYNAVYQINTGAMSGLYYDGGGKLFITRGKYGITSDMAIMVISEAVSKSDLLESIKEFDLDFFISGMK